MSLTVRIPPNYAHRIISNIRNTGNSSRLQDAAIRRLNVQPDGSILVQTSADPGDKYGAWSEVFDQNLGIPFAAIRSFQTRMTSKSEKGVAPESIGGTEIDPQDIAPTVGAGDFQDLSVQEQISPGKIIQGPSLTPFEKPSTFKPGAFITQGTTDGPSFDPNSAWTATDGNIPFTKTDIFPEDQEFDDIISVDPPATVADTEVQSAATMPDSELMDLDAEQSKQFAEDYRDRLQLERDLAAGEEVEVEEEDTGIPENLPQFWKDRYDEYQALSDNLQQIILLNGIQNYIELEPYQLAEAGIANVTDPTQVDPTQVDPTQVDPTQITGFEGDQPDYVNPMTGVGPVTPFRAGMPEPLTLEGVPVNSLGDMLNLFYANPSRYIVETPIIGTTGYDANGNPIEGVLGTQQSLSPVAQAALQAFSTQRGAESADFASRYGTTSPFGAIAGLGGTSAEAITLAQLQAKAGVNNPFAALQTGATVGDISTLLRGGLNPEQQLALAQAPGNPFGLSAQQQIDLQNQLARGGLTAQEQLALAGLQARGGISPEQRLAEQRMALLPQLFQTSPQALGGLQRILGETQLQEALSPFFSAGNFQPVPPPTPEPSIYSVPFTQTQPGFDINPDIALGAGSPASTMTPSNQPTTQNISSTTQPISAVSPGFRPTVGQYQTADLFDRGGFEADAGMSGKELTPFLQEVTPLAAPTGPGGLGAQTTTRFTY